MFKAEETDLVEAVKYIWIWFELKTRTVCHINVSSCPNKAFLIAEDSRHVLHFCQQHIRTDCDIHC